ncbi:MAG: S24/S26 family peptidase [Clostridia bacterium]|nr:S24/S26 family peptidase [Clostridia bacterium]MBR5007257.1 S24/S26 family peptidase [Clostridia bacterium]
METDRKSIRQTIDAEGFVICPTKGISMYPLLREGETLVRVEKTGERLKKYDAALFERKNGELVLHRVLAVREGYYLFCGDNSVMYDRVEDGDVLGVMKGFYVAADGSYKSADDPEVLKYVADRWSDPAKRHIFTPGECGVTPAKSGSKAPIIRRIFPSEARLAADFPEILEHPKRRLIYTFGYWGKALKRKLHRR